METTLSIIWAVIVFGFCAIGIFAIARKLHRLPKIDAETKARIEQGEIDNFSEYPIESCEKQSVNENLSE